MSIRILQFVERNVVADLPKIVLVPSGVNTNAFQDVNGNRNVAPTIAPLNDEVKSRIIFNCGTVNVYYCIGGTCDTTENFNGWIVPGQQLDCSDHGRAVNVSTSAAGGQIALTFTRRKDLENRN